MGPYGTLRDLAGSRAHGTGPYGQLTGSLRDAYGSLTGRLRDLTGSLRELTGSVRELTGLRAYEGLTGFGVACQSVCWTVQAPFQAVQGLPIPTAWRLHSACRGLRAYGQACSTGLTGCSYGQLTGSYGQLTGSYGHLTGRLRDAHGTLTGPLRDAYGTLRDLTGPYGLTGLRAYGRPYGPMFQGSGDRSNIPLCPTL